jgi:hypothetical protein
VVISTVSGEGLDNDFGETLVEAALDVGVKWFIPSEFGADYDDSICTTIPVLTSKLAVANLLKQNQSRISHTFITPGMLLDWGFDNGFLSFDIPNRTVTLYGEGKARTSGTTLPNIAKAVIVLPTLFLVVAYWMANINPYFLDSLVFQLLPVLVAESLGLLFGVALQSLQHAMTAATVLLLSLMLVGGFFVRNLPHWLGVWGKWLSFFKYAYNACLQLQFNDGRIYKCVDGSYVASCRNNPNGTFISNEALAYFDVGIGIGWSFLVLFGMFVVFRTLAYLALRFIKNSTGRA